MSKTLMKLAALSMAIPGLALAAPTAAAAPVDFQSAGLATSYVPVQADVSAQYDRDRRWDRRDRYDRYRGGYGNRDRYHGQRVHRNTRVWRGRNGQYYCRKDDGTTGLLIGAGVGALIGNEVAGRGDRTLGAILGALGGGLLGREIDRSNTRCR